MNNLSLAKTKLVAIQHLNKQLQAALSMSLNLKKKSPRSARNLLASYSKAGLAILAQLPAIACYLCGHGVKTDQELLDYCTKESCSHCSEIAGYQTLI